MSESIVIVGSGFAAQQLVKAIRRQDSHCRITVITENSGDEYAKPDLSHVFSKGQSARSLIKLSGAEFAEQQQLRLLAHHRVDAIDPEGKTLSSEGELIGYDKLVLATGAQTSVPPVAGDAAQSIITLNSLDEYADAEQQLLKARSVLVIGAGLVGTEIAMDLAQSGRKVTLVGQSDRVLPKLLPDFIGAQLFQALAHQGVNLQLGTQVESLEQHPQTTRVTLANGQTLTVDAVICATGLRANTALADEAGLATDRGIMVDKQLRSSNPDIFALGDCAQIEGQQLAYLQPILLSANALAKTLLGQPTDLRLPAMLVRVKTPLLPIQLSGETGHLDSQWKIEADAGGITARAFDRDEQLIGFVVTGQQTKQAIPLLRQLPALL